MGHQEIQRAWLEIKQELEVIANMRLESWMNNTPQIVVDNPQHLDQLKAVRDENERLRKENQRMRSQEHENRIAAMAENGIKIEIVE